MKNHYTIVLILLLGTLSCFAQESKQEKETKKWLNDNFLLIKADTFTFDNAPTEYKDFRKMEEDSNLVCNRLLFNNKLTARQAINTERNSDRIRIDTSLKAKEDNFIISKHEVSNYNYRCFTDYVTDSLVREILIKNGYKKYEIPQKKIDVFGRNYTINFSEKIDYKDSLIIDVLIKNKLAFDYGERFYWSFSINSEKIQYRYIENEIEHVINIYPDTLAWISDFTYAFNEPMTNMYFWHPAYDNYPVVGVSYLQCLAYIKWYNNYVNNQQGIKYRLPTENEFEATIYPINKIYNYENSLFYNGFEFDSRFNIDLLPSKKKKEKVVKRNITYLANFMTTLPFFNVYHDRDGYFFTNPIDFFSQTNRKIFNLIGNVSEWTSIKLVYDESLSITEIDSLMLIQEESLKYYESNWRDEFKVFTIKNNLRYLNKLKDDLILIKQRPNNRVVKGGSWAQNETYLHPRVRTIYNENQQKCYIGFRLAATIDDATFKKYFQK
jgi:formylglycine-generating enzyme required for sulfatase activity